jgi:hypothetical protein
MPPHCVACAAWLAPCHLPVAIVLPQLLHQRVSDGRGNCSNNVRLRR